MRTWISVRVTTHLPWWRRLIDWLTGATRRERRQDREMLAWLRKTHR
jgi:hypothetical protein